MPRPQGLLRTHPPELETPVDLDALLEVFRGCVGAGDEPGAMHRAGRRPPSTGAPGGAFLCAVCARHARALPRAPPERP
jgi:hypothetical protein